MNKNQELEKSEMMFDLSIIHFQEIFDDPEYFSENKNGLKAKLIWLNPSDYIDAVLINKPNHKTTEEKMNNLRRIYEEGIKVPAPYLIYGERDEHNNHFGQEGFNRAYTATMIGKEFIPIYIRYRDFDENIPLNIKLLLENYPSIEESKKIIDSHLQTSSINIDRSNLI